MQQYTHKHLQKQLCIVTGIKKLTAEASVILLQPWNNHLIF
jgi:hypothetical protein